MYVTILTVVLTQYVKFLTIEGGCRFMSCCQGKNLTEENFKKLDEIIEKNKSRRGALIPVLHEAQELFGYLPYEVQKRIAEGLNIPMAEVYGVATFYTRFTLKPTGDHKISVCMGTACYVKGADKILDKLKELLKIDVGETTEDGKFSIEATRCLGACGLAPVVVIDNTVYGKLSVDDVEEILSRY